MLWVDKYRLKTLENVTEQDCPHLLFYGPSGSGKKTLIMALLRQMFGASADKVKVENKNWKTDEIIKEMAKNRPIGTKGRRGFKVLVLNEVDKLPREAQHSLRRTMEKYSASCRLILCCNSSSKVTEAVRSRCRNMRINASSEQEIVNVLEFIGKKEGLNSLLDLPLV
ncbi:replication factor C subunit 3 [Olea europaea subsp. europaea]|uniref:Replication factor C subunit 3 n=1 Tax=Olea europaea subsp. europaea TaxID=158383 RepID=A0A8S0R242_OLEEU|nr:replication factor C subunit 3 [Olea europaea subsp. europaea]